MTLPRYNMLQRFWRKWPPMQVLLAHYVGYKPAADVDQEADAEASDEMDDESMSALIQMFGPLPERKKVP